MFRLTLLFKLSIFARKLSKTSEFYQKKYVRIPIKIGFRIQTSLLCLVNIQVQDLYQQSTSRLKIRLFVFFGIQCYSAFRNAAISAVRPRQGVRTQDESFFQLALNANTTFLGFRLHIVILSILHSITLYRVVSNPGIGSNHVPQI